MSWCLLHFPPLSSPIVYRFYLLFNWSTESLVGVYYSFTKKIQRATARIPCIHLYWVPGIRASPLMRELTVSPTYSDAMLDRLSPEDMIRFCKLSIRRQCDQSYRSSKCFHSHGNIPKVMQALSWAHKDVLISRLLRKMLILLLLC